MNIKQTSKIKCLFLVVAMLLNPILVSADALFSNINISDKSFSSPFASIDSTADMPASCHDKNMSSSQQNSGETAECCETPCDCGASGCNIPTAAISLNNTPVFISTYSLNYLRDHYLSFISSPSFPPPIV